MEPLCILEISTVLSEKFEEKFQQNYDLGLNESFCYAN